MNEASERRRQKMLTLMAEYVALGGDMHAAESIAELERVLDEMHGIKAQIDALIAEQARINRLC